MIVTDWGILYDLYNTRGICFERVSSISWEYETTLLL